MIGTHPLEINILGIVRREVQLSKFDKEKEASGMKEILEKIRSLSWRKFEVYEIKNGYEERLGDQGDWEWIRESYEISGEFKLISETENELRFLAVQPLMNVVENGKEIISPPVETKLIIRKS